MSADDRPGASGPNRFHRPTLPGAAHFDAIEGGPDPADLRTAAEQAATALVRGAHGPRDGAGAQGAGDLTGLADRVVHLAETEGLDALAELWSTSPADSVAGALWRLFALRTWVHADPVGAAREYAAGRAHRPVAEVVAGVADPPGPDEVRALLDAVLSGVVRSDFADVLFRAAAFARVTAGGREGESGVRLAATADDLERAGHLELEGRLG